jgi:hypothetical protein
MVGIFKHDAKSTGSIKCWKYLDKLRNHKKDLLYAVSERLGSDSIEILRKGSKRFIL